WCPTHASCPRTSAARYRATPHAGKRAVAAMRAVFACLAACAVTTAAAQQQPAPDQTLDRIVAVVGTRPLLASQIDEEMVQQQAQGQQLPTESAGLDNLQRLFQERLV